MSESDGLKAQINIAIHKIDDGYVMLGEYSNKLREVSDMLKIFSLQTDNDALIEVINQMFDQDLVGSLNIHTLWLNQVQDALFEYEDLL